MEPSVAQNTFWLKLIVAVLTMSILIAFGVVVAGLVWQADKTAAAFRASQPAPAVLPPQIDEAPAQPSVPEGY